MSTRRLALRSMLARRGPQVSSHIPADRRNYRAPQSGRIVSRLLHMGARNPTEKSVSWAFVPLAERADLHVTHVWALGLSVGLVRAPF